MALLIRGCYSLITPTPDPVPSPVASVTPEPTPTPQRTYSTAEVNEFANTNRCWDIVDAEYGFSSPKGDVVGTYKGMGYESEDLDNMYDLTKMAAVALMEPGATDDTAKASLAIDPLAAQIVVDVTNRVYLPRHREIAIEKCQ